MQKTAPDKSHTRQGVQDLTENSPITILGLSPEEKTSEDSPLLLSKQNFLHKKRRPPVERRSTGGHDKEMSKTEKMLSIIYYEHREKSR